MAVTMQTQSTEYVFFGVTGSEPATGAEVAFMTAGTDPTTGDWKTGTVVNSAHALWADAQASGATGDFYVAILIGAFGGNTVTYAEGDYQPWLRLTDTTEQPVRLAPETLTMQ